MEKPIFKKSSIKSVNEWEEVENNCPIESEIVSLLKFILCLFYSRVQLRLHGKYELQNLHRLIAQLFAIQIAIFLELLKMLVIIEMKRIRLLQFEPLPFSKNIVGLAKVF